MDEADAPRVKRFKHQSYAKSLKGVHLPSVLSQTPLDNDLEDHESHFHTSLEHWKQLNLAPGFIKFAHRAGPLSASMPLLLHNWKEIIELWVAALDESDDEGLRAVLDLLQKITHDLRMTLSPVYLDPVLPRLLSLFLRSKTISAPALTTLLATLSALFKFILIPASSTEFQLLEKTWVCFRDIIPRCLPEVQRVMAEVWGGVLRRLKVESKEKAVVLMAESLVNKSESEVQDAVAWCIVYACKSVSQTLHTCTPSLIAPLLDFHLTAPASSSTEPTPKTYTLLRRLFTSLIHHVRNAEHFSCVGDVLLNQFMSLTPDQGTTLRSEEDLEKLRRTMDLISIPAAVRNGSRLTQTHATALLTSFPSVLAVSLASSSAHLKAALLRLATALLTASPDANAAFWMGKGREILDMVWSAGSIDDTNVNGGVLFGISLTGALADLGWAGWRPVGVPLLLRMTSKILMMKDGAEELQKKAVRLVASLWRTKKLTGNDGDIVWRNCVENWGVKRLREMAGAEVTIGWDEATRLTDILTLSSFFSVSSGITPVLVELCEAHMSSGNVSHSSLTSAPSHSWFIGTCMRALSQRPAAEWEDLDLARWVRTCVVIESSLATSVDVLEGLVALLGVRDTTEISIEELYPALAPSVLSHSRVLRLSALRLFAATQPSDAREVVKRCLAGEEVPLEVQGVRERVLRIGRVETVVKDKQREEDIGPDLCARWLVAQLKVNLRPLWSPAAGALAQMSQRFGDEVWDLLFRELQGLYSTLHPSDNSGLERSVLDDGEEVEDEEKDPWEEERTWRDPSAHKLRGVVSKRLSDKNGMKELFRPPGDRLDVQTYESQLLFALGECPTLVHKHNRDIVPFFLGLASPGEDASFKFPRHKLTAWLTLFSKLSNPKALHSTDALRDLYIANLSHPDRTLQTVSLSCLLTYKSPRLAAYEAQIHALLDDIRWRDELMRLDLGKVEPQDREEVVDVIIRLLFGLMLEKKGRSHGSDRRAAVLGTLAGCTDEELGLLIDLMLRSLNSDRASRRQQPFEICAVPADVSEKQQIGFVGLLGDVLRNLGPRIVQYWPALLGTTIDFIAQAQVRIDSAGRAEETEVDPDDEASIDIDEPNPSSSSKILRSIRQLGLKRLADFFRCPVQFDYAPYIQTAFPAFISPRLSSLDKENTQAPSALLELFYVWTLDGERVMFLTQYDDKVLPKVYDCLIATNVKPTVVSKIFDIVEKLLAFSTIDPIISDKVVKPHVSLLLNNLAILERTKGTASVSSPLGQRQISILAEIAQYSTDVSQASALLTLFAPLLRKPPKVVPERVKVNLLKIIGTLMSLIPDLADSNSDVYLNTYELLSQLFQTLRSRPARLSLVDTFHHLALIVPSLERLAQILESLNAYSSRRVDEPDFDRRLAVFATLNETLYKSLSSTEWLPLLYNMLNFIQDPAELAIRNNSSFTMRHFVDLVARTSPEVETMFTRVLYPGMKNGLRSKNEMVRSEILGVLAYAVLKCENISFLQEMRVLLADGDEEANFFNNIHHIQIHRRSRALRRLADQCDEGHFRSNTLAEIFVPLVGNYIVTTSSIDHHLVNDAILTTGRLAKHLAWGAYYALVQKYLRLSRAKDASERVYVRTLVSLLDNFHFPMEQPVHSSDIDANEDDEDPDVDEDITLPQIPPPTNSSARIVDAVNLRLLPNLLNHLEKRDATTEDTTRIPIAIGIVTVAKHLPATTREPQIARLLTVLSQVLRSKSQETRDLTRDTLSRIAVSLGPTYLPLMLREMRAALLRGPQLHVLAYVTHALLVHVSSEEHSETFGNLDDCVNDVACVSAEVIFGESAKDVMAEEFKTKMREVRSSSAKGLDAFGIVARYITPPRISSLLVPLRAIMQETESVKVMQLVEDVLKRVASGLNANKHLIPTEFLVLCHTLISQNARFLKQAPTKRKGRAKGDAIVQTKRQVHEETDHYANNSFRFVTFGLDLFNTALRRNRFDLHDPQIIKRLESMVVVIGNTLYSSSSPVLVFGLKSAAGIVKCPLKSLEKSLPVFVQQTIDIIKQAGSTESEVVQVALKSLATILRDGSSVQVKEKDLVYLLELLSPDLEEPSRQASVFTMLRAIVARKFVVPEIYDVMDKVSEIMVTSQSPQVQELCRSVLFQFLLDYPQGKGRLRNQMNFLAKNLLYEYESGRKSVLELLGAVLAKFEVGLVREYVDLLFVALVLVIANDDSTKCREMAAQLIKTLFTRLDDDRRRVILSHLHSWASQYSQPQLTRVSSQVYGLVIDVMAVDASPYISGILEDIDASLERSYQQLKSMQSNDDDECMDVDLEWQLPYHSLIVLSKILRVFPDLLTNSQRLKWEPLVSHLLFPHAWVRTAACRLLGILFTSVPPAIPQDADKRSPLTTSGMREVATKLCTQLKSEHLDEALSMQVVKNLFYVGKCFYAIPVPTIEEMDTEKSELNDGDGVADGKELNPLPWLFSKLSYQIRSAHIARRNRTFSTPNWSQQPLAALRWFAAMAAHMDPSRLEKFLIHIFTPAYRIAEDDTIRDSQMDELKITCVELQDLVQSKVGTTKFSTAYNQIRQSVLGIQRERKATKALQVTVNPEAAARRRLQRNSIKKESRKRKNSVFADNKGRVKRRRED